MTARDVYKQYGTPKNLRGHMLSVASLICVIRDHWKGEDVDWNSLIIAGLLHDLGNVTKIDLDKFPDLLGDDLPQIDFWRKEQARLIEKYGNDDHAATDKMLSELGINTRIKDVIQTKSFGNIRTTATLNDWLPKILQYCDLRVSPYGLMGLDERIQEIRERYEKYARMPAQESLAAAKSIEDQIQQSMNVDIHMVIDDSSLTKYKVSLEDYKVN